MLRAFLRLGSKVLHTNGGDFEADQLVSLQGGKEMCACWRYFGRVEVGAQLNDQEGADSGNLSLKMGS